MDILTVFCEIDDFCNEFEPRFNQMLIGDGTRQRNKPGAMSLSEVMTILVLFHLSGYRNLKTFYTGFVCQYWYAEFPHLSSYGRFVERQRDALIPLSVLSASETRSLHGHFVCGRDDLESLSEFADSTP